MIDSAAPTDFDKLLELLDRDRDAAGLRYEALRVRLSRFFEWRACEIPDELADTVFDRMMRKIAEGESILNPEAYASTVAQFVLKEHLRNPVHRSEPIDDNPAIAAKTAKDAPDDDDEDRLNCLDRCLANFDAETRRLLVAYHDTDERTMIATRKRLAEELEISLNTLRIRICRLKSKLEICVRDCCEPHVSAR